VTGRRAGLLERDEELGEIDAAIVAARDGRGGVLVLEGEAGIGKTALVRETCARAERSGMRVLTARGAELEGDFPFGVVRQLFEPALHAVKRSEREDLLSGAAGLAGPVVAPDQESDRPAAQLVDQLHAVVHGLYWLTANLAERCPLLVAVDDAHWSDSSSLR
jgi:predicted ATPase